MQPHQRTSNTLKNQDKAGTTAGKLGEIAKEAMFQMACDKEHIQWLGALMRAIQDNAKHRGSGDVLKLATLGQYLADTQISLAEEREADLESKIADLETAQ
ncbi:hypothetical protein PUP66_23150 [Pseudomonas chlororaphis]|uniref:hypothetical protein n=1 Tax=Pseudomonas chlororaphis TaxID=587753 RepID=UPI000F5540E0|nr:hypothetical protein [Pseudomonas chlororaphis]AZD17385.1 hypothetical protein C4K25_4474 [Pseudomonas chlororaphis]WDH45961.1 hypothetical protein PUP66_23150 [Pseudomonas chlororaphis]WDH57808.1 hypothetical protein PUP56_23155 [Pseudomonas chlororaphis]WQE17065.1 hypothetical protein U0007_21970 [Pseudomonas chlororaphis]